MTINSIKLSYTTVLFAICLVPILSSCTHAQCIDNQDAHYSEAARYYHSKQYRGASMRFEAIARELARCERQPAQFNPEHQRAIALILITAGEAAHWANENARGRRLVKEAMSRLDTLVPYMKVNHELGFLVSSDYEQAQSDLRGLWTLGVRL